MPGKSANSNGQAGEALQQAMTPALNSFHLSQRMALEAVQFWARRLRAYADQMEALSKCEDATQIMTVQQEFISRMREDYTKEGETVRRIVETDKSADARSI
ncbi:MAG: hypothetical protein GC189_13180 [Alphaproteobacteria bacterium]|nr:hypothetical protein [Alphaproteobacteria bacterium]